MLAETASAQVDRRQRGILKKAPWPLFTLGDPRLGDSEAESVVRKMATTPTCCLKTGFERFFFAPVLSQAHALAHLVPERCGCEVVTPVTSAMALLWLASDWVGTRQRGIELVQTCGVAPLSVKPVYGKLLASALGGPTLHGVHEEVGYR